MSSPLAGAEELPYWQLRLLERIQTTSYIHHRTLFYGYPQYSTAASGPNIQLEAWRTNLAALEAERGEIELHAHSLDIPQRMIDYATETGARGARWGETPETARLPMAPEGANFLEQISGDVWTLEHAALVRAEYMHRVHTGALPDNEAGERQLHDNMAALWRRIKGTAALIDRDPGTAQQLWGRGPESWQRLAELTAASYTDAELQQRFGELSWKGIEAEVSRAFDNQATSKTTDLEPPTPWQVAENAEKALAAVGFADEAAPHVGRDIGSAVEATGAGTGAQWEPEPEQRPHPPDLDIGVGRDQGVWS
ncbi:hypothetical protein ACFU44_06015 [Nocardia rhizosphaerihabitans]|uniref:hypothetical protein n=1 Tax=Nocardia rhizosphaerihabitans TaxID=1691570 RepID=UPI00366E459E